MKSGDNGERRQHSSAFHGEEPWTQRDLNLLHDMIREYEAARIFRRQAKWYALWFMGIPGAALAFWEPLEKLWRLLKGH